MNSYHLLNDSIISINFKRSAVDSSGSSIAAKCPPDGNSSQCTTLYVFFRQVRGVGKNTGSGNAEIPVGKSIYVPAGNWLESSSFYRDRSM